jgi:formylglycine-generating enzyme required for sulfatase activity
MTNIPDDFWLIARAVWENSQKPVANRSGNSSASQSNFAESSLDIEAAIISPGSFLMGSPEHQVPRYLDEGQVRVEITRGFMIAKKPVTQRFWKAFMGTDPWVGTDRVRHGDNYPAVCVSWDDAVAFCDQLTEFARSKSVLPPGVVFRLPTEAEWEYACRAGTTTAYSFGDDETVLGDYAWFGGNTASEQYAHEVAQKKPNPYGLYDMHGNIWEWCLDLYGPLRGGIDPSGPSDRSDPVSEDGVSYRVFRGGCWRVDALMCRSANRDFHVPTSRDRTLGFRVVLGPAISASA